MTSIQHTAPTSEPRRDTEAFAYAPPANHWLRMIYAALIRIRCLLACVDGHEVGDEDVPEGELVEVLAANGRSKSVTVHNDGDRALLIYEGGAVVLVVLPGEFKDLLVPGLLTLSARIWDAGDANEGQPASVRMVRRLRCACGDEEVVYTPEPVGAFLL